MDESPTTRTFPPVIASTFLPIGTERLVLRRLERADAAGLAAYRSDPAVARYQSWQTPYPLAAAQRLIEEMAHLAGPSNSEWVQIAVEHDGALIGDVAVHLN